MEWLDLVVPAVAILALFAAIGLIVTAVRQGRAIRRLEERLARTGDSAVEAPLQRIADLQARHAPHRAPRHPAPAAHGAAVGVSALVLVALVGGVWYLFIRDDDGSASADTGRPAAATQQTQAAPAAPPPDQAAVPDEVPTIDKSAHTVAVFNASGIDGVAGDIVAPALENEGYQVPLVANPLDGDTDRQKSVVMYSDGQRRAAQNVAKDLGIARAPPLDGYTTDQVGDVDVIVLVARHRQQRDRCHAVVTVRAASAGCRGGAGGVRCASARSCRSARRKEATMAVYPATAAGRARADVHRLRLSRHQVYACRSCRDAVRVTSAHYLPEGCPACGASTWGTTCAARTVSNATPSVARDPGPCPLPRLWAQRLDPGERQATGAPGEPAPVRRGAIRAPRRPASRSPRPPPQAAAPLGGKLPPVERRAPRRAVGSAEAAGRGPRGGARR